MTVSTHVAIIGAGPYGLSVAAHLRQRGVDFRIFGTPLLSWRAQMPKGMFLKSEGFASNLFDPEGRHTLKRFCAERGLSYDDHTQPVPLDTFVAYGLSFQQHLVPNVEERNVVSLRRAPQGFALRLDNGESFTARRVVIAAGIRPFRYVPDELQHLPPEILSHASDHHDLGSFRGHDVAVLGGGSSAFDTVAALHDAGVDVRLIARRLALRWNPPVQPKPAWKRALPTGGLGPGWRNYIFEHAPLTFRRLPKSLRLYIVRRWLGPAGGWPTKAAVEQTAVMLGQTLRQATFDGKRVRLDLVGADGEESAVSAERIIAATGYRTDLRRLDFLGEALCAEIRAVANTPVLSRNFESSVPGLYFTGAAAANTFGPVMRFLLGARVTARRIANHLAKASSRLEANPSRQDAVNLMLGAER